jgi:hypothetical protein
VQPAEEHLVVVDGPAAGDQDRHRHGVDPVHDADHERVQAGTPCPRFEARVGHGVSRRLARSVHQRR